jgi:hypothetical protein
LPGKPQSKYRDGPEEEGMPDPQQLMRIQSLLFQPNGDRLSLKTYAILDAARDKVLYPKIVTSGIKGMCLYHGEKSIELATVAPYLVLLERENPFTDWLLNQGWGKSWGIFLNTSETLEKLQRHFRQFLMVYTEDGKLLYFRFYDPRVFRVYLPTCNEAELKTVFGPVTTFLSEGQADSLIEFTCTQSFELISNEVSFR